MRKIFFLEILYIVEEDFSVEKEIEWTDRDTDIHNGRGYVSDLSKITFFDELKK